MRPAKPTIDFVFFDAGGGHRSAATALKTSLAAQRPDWDVRLVNLQEMLEPIDPLYVLTGIQSEKYYNSAIKKGWTYGSRPFLRGLQKGISFYSPYIEKYIRAHWEKSRPDLVVSLIPNFNAVMFSALRAVHPQVPYVTIMTDMADYPSHFWQEKQDQYMICGTQKAAEQARALKAYRPERILETSGMILKPGFYAEQEIGQRALRIQYGLDPDLPTALIMFGGNGSKASVKILKRLKKSSVNLQAIVMCGSNDELRKELETRERCLAVGFTDKVATYMHMADFFIGKPGPGSISEAVQMGLPVIVERNAATMPQERYNTVWVEENKVGLVIKKFKHIHIAVDHLIAGNRLKKFQRNARNLCNRAIFEIPAMLENILDEAASEAATHPKKSPRTSPQDLHI